MLLLSIQAVLAADYAPLEGLAFETSELRVLPIDDYGISMRYRYSHGRNDFYGPFVQEALLEAARLSLAEIRDAHADATDCRPHDVVDIYQVGTKVLNNPRRFEIKRRIPAEIWGFYDPRVDEHQIDTIVVTPRDFHTAYTVLVHEAAHYWYARYCLDRHSERSSEQFAERMQWSIDRSGW